MTRRKPTAGLIKMLPLTPAADMFSGTPWSGVSKASSSPKGSTGNQGPVVRCCETHKPLQIGPYTIYGGSCTSPVIKDADIYIGLDRAMVTLSKYPWEDGPNPVEVLFPISDQHAPQNITQFKAMVRWIIQMLKEGKKIHIGCLGGHGRTGLTLVAIVALLAEELGLNIEDCITFVRENYCEKAVESASQIGFLVKHYGVKKAEPRDYGRPTNAHTTVFHGGRTFNAAPPQVPLDMRESNKDEYDVTPNHSNMLSVWGDEVEFDKLQQPVIIT